VTFTVADAAGNSSTCTAKVTVVDKTPPAITCPPNQMFVHDPGACSSNKDPMGATATDNCGTPNITYTRSDGAANLNDPYPSGPTTVTATATDASGNQSTCSFTVTVTNQAPIATITGPPSGQVKPVGTPVEFTGTWADADLGDTVDVLWTFTKSPGGQPQSQSVGGVAYPNGTVTGSFAFDEPGVYAIQLTLTDDCGAQGEGANTVSPGGLPAYVVIYDPSAGFVTGGGWINSPAGAFYGNNSLAGKASFGFVSRYKKGATVPDGDTEFQFKAGNLNFKSKVYDWLVISGCRAQYKGSGTINGAGDYGFILTAIDGQINGGGNIDRFRIKIWKKSDGCPVYDNQSVSYNDDNAALTGDGTLLGGGSIVIHK
jgi:hypothetical protein